MAGSEGYGTWTVADGRRWWPVDAAAERSGLPEETIRAWCREGRLPCREAPGIFEPELLVDAAALEAEVARPAPPVEPATPAEPTEPTGPGGGAGAEVIPVEVHNRLVELLRETSERAERALRELAEERSRRSVVEAEATRLRHELQQEREAPPAPSRSWLRRLFAGG